MAKEFFPRVKAAREALRAKAEEILDQHLATINEARAAEQFAVAIEAQQWLIDHMPEEDGERMIEASADKTKIVEGNSGPKIQIGIALGGVNQPKGDIVEAKVIKGEIVG